MLNRKKSLLISIIFLQVLFFVFWAVSNELKLTNPKSKTILLETIPVDPRDLISGNYFILNYKISQSGFSGNDLWNGEIFAVLKKQDQYYVLDYFSKTKPAKIKENQVVLEGEKKRGRIKYGIEKYFINENTKTPTRSDKVDVLLNIDDNFKPVIIKIYVNDKEFDQNNYQK
ncbi:MAG: putative membrane-anchored protein [Rickettsiales bacterium]|jgi:uncharacterized membrane-anchored protein